MNTLYRLKVGKGVYGNLPGSTRNLELQDLLLIREDLDQKLIPLQNNLSNRIDNNVLTNKQLIESITQDNVNTWNSSDDFNNELGFLDVLEHNKISKDFIRFHDAKTSFLSSHFENTSTNSQDYDHLSLLYNFNNTGSTYLVYMKTKPSLNVEPYYGNDESLFINFEFDDVLHITFPKVNGYSNNIRNLFFERSHDFDSQIESEFNNIFLKPLDTVKVFKLKNGLNLSAFNPAPVDGQYLSKYFAITSYRKNGFKNIPSASNSSGHKGDLAADGNHLYVCVENNNWKRITLETF